MPNDQRVIIQMDGITKHYPGGVVANDDVSLTVRQGEIHAIIGENGAGKTTLMNVLYGRVQPDRGAIQIDGNTVAIGSPAHAIQLGLGFVTQHTTLIPAFTALENVILGAEPLRAGLISTEQARLRIFDIAARLSMNLDWSTSISELSVAARQKVEIIKALYRGARILILDEPTATLAPQEADALYAMVHTLVDLGATVLFITHKLQEVIAHSQHVTVLRGGRLVGERVTAEVDGDTLLDMMLGHMVESPKRPEASSPNARRHGIAGANEPDGLGLHSGPALVISNLNVKNDRGALAVRDVSLAVTPGEIVGIAGVDGSGQRELAEVVMGLRTPESGDVLLRTENVTRLPVGERLRKGIAYIAEDRLHDGLIGEFTVAENLVLGRHRRVEAGGGRTLRWAVLRSDAKDAINRRSIATSGPDALASGLSGGNQQKVVIARALADDPRVLVAMQPTRGLDVEASRQVYCAIREATERGMAVLLFSLDLDEVMDLSDRVAVMYNGEINAILRREQATPAMVGAYMVGGQPA